MKLFLFLVTVIFTFFCFTGCERTQWKDDKGETLPDNSEQDNEEPVVTDDDVPEIDEDETVDLSPDEENQDDDDEIEIDEDPVDDTDYCIIDPSVFDQGIESADVFSMVEYDSSLFPMTVQAGHMESENVILWGYTEDNDEKTLVVWREAVDEEKVVIVKEFLMIPEDGYMKKKVEGLAPGTWYNYGFFTKADEEIISRSIIGRFKTAIHPECMEVITITGTHGTNFKHKYTALELSMKFNADFFVQLGDFSYNDDCKSTDDFRSYWFRTLSNTDYKKILPTIGQYIVWDDHEVEDNSKYEPNLKKDLAKVHRGLEAWFESLPVEKREGVENNWGNPSYYNSYKWGKTLELFLLDCRAERIPDTRNSSDAIYISKKQMNWFKDALLKSDAHFKVVANSVPIAHYGGLWDVALADRWEGYKAQRNEILNFIVDNDIKNVVWLSGDFHTGSVAPVDKPETPWNKMWEINMGPAGNTNILGDMGKIPNFLWNTGKMNATVIVFDPFKDSIYVKYLDPEKETVMFEVELFGENALTDPIMIYTYLHPEF
jgi:phosphodiesterase/alkaline phosphatase D-like protein